MNNEKMWKSLWDFTTLAVLKHVCLCKSLFVLLRKFDLAGLNLASSACYVY